MDLNFLKGIQNDEKLSKHFNFINFEPIEGINLEWLLVESLEEAVEYHYKYFSFFPDEVIEKLAFINFENKQKYAESIMKEICYSSHKKTLN